MKYNIKTALLMISLFFFSQIVGLFVINQNFVIFGAESFASEEIVVSDAYSILVSIIIISIIFIILYKLKLKRMLIMWYSLAFVTCVSITLGSFINEIYALIIAISLLIIKFDTRDNFFHNMCELLIYGGIAIIILPMLNLWTSIILLIIISVYDFIAVKISKHMITLAKTQFKLNIFSGLKIEQNNTLAVLGGGDILFPLLLAGVMLRDYSLLTAILVSYGALIGLITLILTGKQNKFYPAMPFISAGCFIGLFIGLFLL